MRKYSAILALILTIGSGAAEAQALKQDFEEVKVGDGIYAFIASEPNSGVVQGNVILITGEQSALLVDAGQFPSLAERMAARVRQLTTKPVRVLVNTHWHGDHILCNHIFRKHFPGIMVIAHEETPRNGEKFYAKWEENVAGFPDLIERLRAAVKSGKRKDGTPLTEDQKVSFQVDADTLEAVLPDVSLSKYDPADMMFQKEISIDLGNRIVRVMNLGWGNTPGDAVIFISDAKVLVTGDTVVFPTPYSFGSNHSEWIEVLNRMMALGATTYVPGHGPVMQDTAYIKMLIALLEDVRTQVRAAAQGGTSLEEVRKRVTLEDWTTRFAGDVEHRRRAFRDFFIAPGLEQAYKEATGTLVAE